MMTAALLLMSLYPDAIYVNGAVITMDARQTEAQAVAVLGDTIVAVGNDTTIEAMVGPDTERIDLEGATLLPGFYAAHDHFPGSGVVALFRVDLNSPPMGEVNTMDELVAALAARARDTPQGQWIRGRGYDDTLIQEKRHPTRADLDRASTEHPIFIAHVSGHLGVANSLALEMAGITKETPVPPGGVIRKDPETGEPNGVFEESMSLVTRLIPPLGENDRLDAIRWAVTDYVEEGVTTTVIAHGSADGLRDLQRARRAGLLSLRVIQTARARAPPPEAV